MKQLHDSWSCRIITVKILTEQTAPMKITIRHGERFLRQLGAYGETVLELLQEAEEANENITVEIEL